MLSLVSLNPVVKPYNPLASLSFSSLLVTSSHHNKLIKTPKIIVNSQQCTFENTSKISINNTNKGNRNKSLNK